ncbi:type I-F CRISPR-associated helicase Cas3 [Acinetobacter baumannii]|uniref:type I-F CRISPR-associated helicase Cas3f n=1 Tax=Acinetobacter baumannii TaxID=470 RepID=UPI00044EFC1F|nr:type I-F CRISPR-associated helicase Cas3f [Acinetobacter baumannii]EHU2374131.1 type I-F CRISPR-associated helicase Cas3 [Acinetobacter baumannii]EHU2749731.1 type I-F CRISPR-associated helicase Cas3 [Acinetobacter baumannii]EXE90039.1 CRISPR-associated helicase Cas3, subtype I-F/YPEST [Acinetobacter baumannii 532279]
MFVTFISQCEKKAIPRTRRVLDAFADRIGDNTWQTVITEDGLLAVKKLLRKTVTKNTAVSCHWIRGRRRSELLWVVGNRNKFNEQGIVPVNTTKKSLAQNKWENDWHYLPLIKALVAVSALLHDWGKATVLFQQKLLSKNDQFKGDPLRHEWISCMLLNALVQSSGNTKSDEAWLKLLMNQTWDEELLKQTIVKNSDQSKVLDQLPPFAQLVAWLIVSHHRLPNLKTEKEYKKYGSEDISCIKDLFEFIEADWGYQNKFEEKEYQQRLQLCFEFEQGLLTQSAEWTKQVKKWSARLLQESQVSEQIFVDGCWRVILHHARLCLMLGDHYYSSCEADKTWKTSLSLVANTDPKTKQAKQYLDEHLVRVSDNAMRVAQSLSRLADEMESAYDIQKLKKKSPQGFEWQDQAVKGIQQFIQKNEGSEKQGWFIVNMASTGKGKTIANAKIMQALSQDGQSLRYVLALGLRTLTLQTGDSYRHDIGLSSDELAVLIGSKAVQELHHQDIKNNQTEELSIEEIGSESLEELLDNELDYDAMPQAEFMNALFPKNQEQRNKAFLYKPVLTCTIDHLMAATETKRGGKYILPSLRLSSSDLVIDEVDDFNGQDLIAIARLIHLAGMLGRKVMISSATIPPALAEGFFNAYQQGWSLYCAFKKLKNIDTVAMWVDEFKTKTQTINSGKSEDLVQQYKKAHDQFIELRADALSKQIVKHKAYIVDCSDLVAEKEVRRLDQSLQSQYFERIKQNAEQLHFNHHTIDTQTGKKVSFGVVRVANIPPCVALTQYLLNAEWSQGISPRVMAYHSRQVLLLRSEQERHLDQVLKRKEKLGEQTAAFLDDVIRQHLDSTDDEHVIFILVATPVEEVGRDHDFDWAIVEPSSYRSIIQLAGRVLRHRKLDQDIQNPNIALMQYNLKGLRKAKVAFEKPGFEINNDKFKLQTKNLKELLDISEANFNINAIPRIKANQPLQAIKKLADLEHAVMADALTSYKQVGAKPLNSWLTQKWFLTALPQRFTPFRQSSPNIQLFAVPKNHKLVFCEKNDFGAYIDRNGFYDIHHIKLSKLEQNRLWLNRNYYDILCRLALDKLDENEDVNEMIEELAKRYGEIMLPEYDEDKQLTFSEQFGLVVLDK